jgi:hypothetical protein
VLEIADAINSSVELALSVYEKIPEHIKDAIINSIHLVKFSPMTVALAHVEFKKPLNRAVLKKMFVTPVGERLFFELIQKYVAYLNHRDSKFDPAVDKFIAAEMLLARCEL